MTKKVILFLLFFSMVSFGIHRFYVGMFQLKFVPKKQEMQITTRVFIDDLTEAINKQYKAKTSIGEKNEIKSDEELAIKYFNKNFKIIIDGKSQEYIFLSKEVKENSLICYFKIKNLKKINSLQVENTMLLSEFPQQQNIIQFENIGQKSSLLLSGETIKGMLK